MNHRMRVVLTLLPSAIAATCSANPLLSFPDLDEAAISVIESRGVQGSEVLSDLILEHGFVFLPETLDLIRGNFSILEPLLLPCAISSLDLRLHQEIRRSGSRAFIADVCAGLRRQLVFPNPLVDLDCQELATRAEESFVSKQIAHLLETAEVLSDYRDEAAVPYMRALLDSLSAVTCIDEAPDYFHESATWYLNLACSRIRTPESRAILFLSPDGLRLCRSASEIARVEVKGPRQATPEWWPLDVTQALQERLIHLLSDAQISPLDTSYRLGDARMRVCFRDGGRIQLQAAHQATLVYMDNTRYDGNRMRLQNPELFEYMEGLADSVATAWKAQEAQMLGATEG